MKTLSLIHTNPAKHRAPLPLAPLAVDQPWSLADTSVSAFNAYRSGAMKRRDAESVVRQMNVIARLRKDAIEMERNLIDVEPVQE